MPFAAALIDLDGTLLDTIADLADATNAMRLDMGMHALSQEIIGAYVGKGTPHLVVRALSDAVRGTLPAAAQVEHGLTLFSRHYHKVNGDKAIVYPGVIAGLKAFQDQGTKLAVVTNKPAEFARPLLERMGLMPFFDEVVCGDTCSEKKPSPMPLLHGCNLLDVTPSQALAIGDSVNDALAARAANITVLAVPYGYNEGLDVRSLEVDDIVMSIEAAAQWAARH